jgi:hypothetical protein
VLAGGNTPAGLARAAAEWFERHWEDWKLERDKPRPSVGDRTWRVPWR